MHQTVSMRFQSMIYVKIITTFLRHHNKSALNVSIGKYHFAVGFSLQKMAGRKMWNEERLGFRLSF